MPGSNAQRLRDIFARWNSGDQEPPLEEIDPEFELDGPITSVSGKPYRGHEGLRRWSADVREQFEEFRPTIEETRESGDRVLALGRIRLRGRASGVQLDQPLAWLVDFRDGRVLRVRAFTDHQEGLSAFAETP